MAYYCQQCWNFYHACDCISSIDVDGLPIARAPNDDDNNDNDTGGNPNPDGNGNPNPNPDGNGNPNPNPNDGVSNPNPNSLGVVNPNSDWIQIITAFVDADGNPTAGLEQNDEVDIKWNRNIPSNKRKRPTKSMVVTVYNTDGSKSVDYVVPQISYFDVYENGDKRNWLFHMMTPDSVDAGIPRAHQYPEKYQDLNMKLFMKWYVKSTNGVNNCDIFWDMIEQLPPPFDYNSGVRYYADCKSFSGTGWSDYSGKTHEGYPEEKDWPNVDPNGHGPYEDGQVYIGTYPRMWDMNFKRFPDEFIEENSLDGKSFIDEWPNSLGPPPEGWRSFYNYVPTTLRSSDATKYPYIFPDAYESDDEYNGYMPAREEDVSVVTTFITTTVPVVRPFSFYARRSLQMVNLGRPVVIEFPTLLYNGNPLENGDRDNYIIGFPFEEDGFSHTFAFSGRQAAPQGSGGIGFSILEYPSVEVVIDTHLNVLNTPYTISFNVPADFVSYYGMIRIKVIPKSNPTSRFIVESCQTMMTKGFTYRMKSMESLGATGDMVRNSFADTVLPKAFTYFEQPVDGYGKPCAWICHGYMRSTKDISGQTFWYDSRVRTLLHLTSHVGYNSVETKSTFNGYDGTNNGYVVGMVIREAI